MNTKWVLALGLVTSVLAAPFARAASPDMFDEAEFLVHLSTRRILDIDYTRKLARSNENVRKLDEQIRKLNSSRDPQARQEQQRLADEKKRVQKDMADYTTKYRQNCKRPTAHAPKPCANGTGSSPVTRCPRSARTSTRFTRASRRSDAALGRAGFVRTHGVGQRLPSRCSR